MADNPISITTNFAQLRRRIESIKGRGFKRLREAFRDISNSFITKHKEKNLSGRPGLRRQTGTLARSFRYTITGGNTDTLRSTIFTGTKYAAIHEFGGVIKPKNGPYLIIPVLKGSRYAIYQKFNKPGQGGKLLAALGRIKRISKSSKAISFRMVKQVYIPPRMKFISTWKSPENVASIQRRLSVAMELALKEAASG